MKRLFLLILTAEIVFVALLTLVRGVLQRERGLVATQLHAELQLIDDTWCWQELCAGKTVYSTILKGGAVGDDIAIQPMVGNAALEWKSRSDPTWYGTISRSAADRFVYVIHINLAEKELRLGDVLTQFGEPSIATTVFMMSQRKKGMMMTTFLCYEGGLCVTFEPEHCTPLMQFDVYAPIQHVFLYPAERVELQFTERTEWQSINRQQMYCSPDMH